MYDENWNALEPDSRNWLPCDIVDYYDAHLNTTLAELSRMTGRTIPELKRILMSE